jgi:hypothetical protein
MIFFKTLSPCFTLPLAREGDSHEERQSLSLTLYFISPAKVGIDAVQSRAEDATRVAGGNR